MTILPPFRITQDDIDRRALEADALGARAVLVCGCRRLFDSRETSRRAFELLPRAAAIR